MGRMIHYTLNTGDTTNQSRGCVAPEAIKALRALVDRGGPIPDFAPFRVTVDHGSGCALFTVWRGKEPIVGCALAWTAAGEAEVWPGIEELYLDMGYKGPELETPRKNAAKQAA